jgi:hypothetical protein
MLSGQDRKQTILYNLILSLFSLLLQGSICRLFRIQCCNSQNPSDMVSHEDPPRVRLLQAALLHKTPSQTLLPQRKKWYKIYLLGSLTCIAAVTTHHYLQGRKNLLGGSLSQGIQVALSKHSLPLGSRKRLARSQVLFRSWSFTGLRMHTIISCSVVC